MVYLFWGLINIVLFLFFIVLGLKATKFVRAKVGLFAAIIFACGLLSFVGNSNNDNKEPNSNHIKTWEYTLDEENLDRSTSYSLDINLEKNLVSKYYLGILYGKDKSGEYTIPIGAHSFKDGFVGGTNWKPVGIMVNRTNDKKNFEYIVDGILEWKLLGATIYSQSKTYKGITSLK